MKNEKNDTKNRVSKDRKLVGLFSYGSEDGLSNFESLEICKKNDITLYGSCCDCCANDNNTDEILIDPNEVGSLFNDYKREIAGYFSQNEKQALYEYLISFEDFIFIELLNNPVQQLVNNIHNGIYVNKVPSPLFYYCDSFISAQQLYELILQMIVDINDRDLNASNFLAYATNTFNHFIFHVSMTEEGSNE